MKLCYLIINILLALSLSINAHGAEKTDDAGKRVAVEKVETLTRTAAAETDVIVSLFLESGNIVVRGWDKKEVRARVTDAERLELRPGGTSGDAKTVRRLDVLVTDSEDEELRPGDFGGSGNVELDVPRGATINLKLRQGDIEISNVGEVRVDNASGDVDIRRVMHGAEVVCVSGNVYVEDSRGRMRLTALSGDVEAIDVRPTDEKEDFVAVSTSGDVRLESIGHARVEGRTLSGDVSFDGLLVEGGSYDLKTTSGDVVLAVPAASSFRFNARVVEGGEIISDFLVKSSAPKPLKQIFKGVLSGIVGKGEAEVSLSSFGGTVHLRKK